MDFSGLPISNESETSAMEMVGNAMAQPHFQPDNFWAMAFSPQYEDVARAATTGGGLSFIPGDTMPKQEAPLGNFANNGNGSSNGNFNGKINGTINGNINGGREGGSAVPGMPSVSGDPRMQPTPLVDALKMQGNIPPWLWNDPSASAGGYGSGANTPVTTASNGGGGDGRQPLSASGVARTFSFPLTPGNDGLQHDDIDVNMDEDFNWADWGQSLMETSAGMGGVWGSHGM